MHKKRTEYEESDGGIIKRMGDDSSFQPSGGNESVVRNVLR